MTLLEARGVGFTYGRRQGAVARRIRPVAPRPPSLIAASAGVAAGECLGVVGESGSGKTTFARVLTGLAAPSEGEVLYDGEVVSAPGRRPQVPRPRGVQIVFQDPWSSLNPRRTVGSVLREILDVHSLRPGDAVGERVAELLDAVGLSVEHADARPSRLSGGQRQRVAIARALAFEPRVVVADEVVSALDASVQAQILNLLARLRAELGLAIVFVTHDFAVVRQLCERVVVMTEGRIVESGDVDRVLGAPEHPYTRSLLSAVPRLEARAA